MSEQMRAGRVCMTCGARSVDDAKFCSQCGAAFSLSCTHCGTVNLPFSQFCAGCGQALQMPTPPPLPESADIPVVRAPDKAERRHLTVMFCDLSGSTRLSTQLDPEDLYGLLSAYRDAAAEVVTDFGGTIAQYLGDGILAFFGYPSASETDAEHAVRAALEVVDRTSAIETKRSQRLSVRIGIATGLVVVGDRSGAAKDSEKSAAGEALNLAARLQALAPENGVVIAEATRRLVGNIFELREVIFPEAKGFSSAITAFAVHGLSQVESRFEALRTGERTKFVGREEEVSLLLRRWSQIAEGEGRAVLFQGDAGIGKSRVVDQMRVALGDTGHTCLRFFGSPLRSQTALYPVLHHVRRESRLTDIEDEAGKLAAVTGLFAPVAEHQQIGVRLIAGLLGVTAAAGPDLDAISAVLRRERTMTALIDYIVSLAVDQPLLVIFEDAHWMDPTSLELLDRLIAKMADRRILLIVCARPSYQPAWADHAAVTLCNLNRLGVREGTSMIASIAHGKALPAIVTEQILNRSDGVPLFIEELTKAVLESGALVEQEEIYTLEGSLSAPTLPGSLQASLAARLDRLPSAVKTLAQIGAVIGREFSHKVLQSVAELPEAELEDSLAKLVSSGLIHRRGRGADADYIFKHALIQDAAYGTLLKARRQEVHAAIARTLMETYPLVATSQPEILAYHLTFAGDYPAAIQFWLAAGRLQIRASADLEGIQHLQRGLELIGELDNPAVARELELTLHAALIGPLVAIEGPNSKRVAMSCDRGLALLPHGSPYIFAFMYGQFTHCVATGQLTKALIVAQQFTDGAQAAGYDPGVVIGHRLRGMALLGLGKLSEARDALELALALYEPERDDNITYLFGQNAKVNCEAVLSLALCLLGDEQRAKEIGYDAIASANRLKHPHSMAIAMSYFGCWVLELCRERQEMAIQAERLVAISEEYGLGTLGTVGQFFTGWALYCQGGGNAAIVMMEKTIRSLDRAGFRLAVPNFICLLADAKRAEGALEDARETCAWARRMMEETEERWFEPEIICLEAQIAYALAEIDAHEAQARFQKGIECARLLQSPSLEERCANRFQTVFSMQMV